MQKVSVHCHVGGISTILSVPCNALVGDIVVAGTATHSSGLHRIENKEASQCLYEVDQQPAQRMNHGASAPSTQLQLRMDKHIREKRHKKV